MYMHSYIQAGKIIGKRGLKQFTETGCVFEDGSEADDIDLVILATGFNPNLDIIDVPGIKGKKEAQIPGAELSIS